VIYCVPRGLVETSSLRAEATTSSVNVEVSTKHQVTWAASDTEKALKTILTFAKTFAGSCQLEFLIDGDFIVFCRSRVLLFLRNDLLI